MKNTITVEEVDLGGLPGHDPEEELVDVELPASFEVCGRCRGHGTHTNPNIDGNGITSSEWAEWDEEDQETYMAGGYDVPCEECGGARVVLVVDCETCEREPVLKAALDEYNARARSGAESRAIQRAEERYGA
jgi:hypothetical protein